MTKKKVQKNKTAEVLILYLLEESEKYGYQIAHEIEQRSNSVYELRESNLYPVLYKLIDMGVVTVRNEIKRNRLRKYYKLAENIGYEYFELVKSENQKIYRNILKTMQSNTQL